MRGQYKVKRRRGSLPRPFPCQSDRVFRTVRIYQPQPVAFVRLSQNRHIELIGWLTEQINAIAPAQR